MFPAWKCGASDYARLASAVERDLVEVQQLEDDVAGVADISYATRAVRVRSVTVLATVQDRPLTPCSLFYFFTYPPFRFSSILFLPGEQCLLVDCQRLLRSLAQGQCLQHQLMRLHKAFPVIVEAIPVSYLSVVRCALPDRTLKLLCKASAGTYNRTMLELVTSESRSTGVSYRVGCGAR